VKVLCPILLLAALASAQQPYEHAQAVCAEARELRRAGGYAKAIEFLETRLDHPLVLKAYANCCLWGGEEERGLRGLRRGAVPESDRIEAEARLLGRLFRYREAAALARKHGWKEGEESWGAEAALRERLAAREALGAKAAGAGLVALLALWALLRRAFRPSSAPATA
jgi:hypothetical protein